jgi:predicted cation transporter
LIQHSEREYIKENIVSLMISAPLKIQGQLSDIVATIADNDFPHKWANLIPVSVFILVFVLTSVVGFD